MSDTLSDDDKAQADFAAGAAMDTPPEQPARGARDDKPEPKAEEPVVEKPAEPEYAQITKQELAEIRAAASKIASHDQQLSKIHGTTGNLQKIMTELRQQTPRGEKVEISEEKYKELADDFPELALRDRGLFESVRGVTGTGPANAGYDPDKIKEIADGLIKQQEMKSLTRAYPNWRDLTGAVSDPEQAPDQTHPFRAWLATKPAEYQDEINSTLSPADIGDAIRAFHAETAPKAAPRSVDPKEAAARRNIAGAVQPRGDGGAPPMRDTQRNDFEKAFADATGH